MFILVLLVCVSVAVPVRCGELWAQPTLTGTVLSEQGQPVDREVEVDLSCADGRTVVRADHKGRFRLEPGSPEGLDSRAHAGFPFALPVPRSTDRLSGCDLRISAAGYRPKAIHLGVGDAAGIRDIGIVFLARIGAAAAAVDISDLAAPKKARKMFENAMKAVLRGQWSEAERAFEGAVAAHPAYASAWSGLAVCRMMRSDALGAAEAVRRARRGPVRH